MIRKYSNKDKPELIKLFRQNTPEYFDPSEESDYKNYLENEVEDYFVYKENANIIAAGGINYFPQEKLARISWDMVNPNFQGKGIGKELTQYRINYLKEHPEIELIVVRTSQLAYMFYEKLGFELEFVEKDYWAKNFDLYQMKLNNNTEPKLKNHPNL
ncbi:GNAT family N-acetyltransferase [Xanthomarina sp.]|uniref:GNAT family N-acetyltransferase n=1 Tax=Xanthomarina sp. TaxID=1931211 RepID=UPI002C7D3E65|nr:GNAT family N-acetyltransferase [Xanthomarina sp.]HLV39576.1 GNAT family N-acetyltransferase [Xanthomarina sp.]